MVTAQHTHTKRLRYILEACDTLAALVGNTVPIFLGNLIPTFLGSITPAFLGSNRRGKSNAQCVYLHQEMHQMKFLRNGPLCPFDKGRSVVNALATS